MTNYENLSEQSKRDQELEREYRALKTTSAKCRYDAQDCTSCQYLKDCTRGQFLAARRRQGDTEVSSFFKVFLLVTSYKIL